MKTKKIKEGTGIFPGSGLRLFYLYDGKSVYGTGNGGAEAFGECNPGGWCIDRGSDF